MPTPQNIIFTVQRMEEYRNTLEELTREAIWMEDAKERDALLYAANELENTIGDLLCLRFPTQVHFSGWNRNNAFQKWLAIQDEQHTI